MSSKRSAPSVYSASCSRAPTSRFVLHADCGPRPTPLTAQCLPGRFLLYYAARMHRVRHRDWPRRDTDHHVRRTTCCVCCYHAPHSAAALDICMFCVGSQCGCCIDSGMRCCIDSGMRCWHRYVDENEPNDEEPDELDGVAQPASSKASSKGFVPSSTVPSSPDTTLHH